MKEVSVSPLMLSTRMWKTENGKRKKRFRKQSARLKTLEAIAKIRDKENKILSTSFIILEWSLQRQKYETDVSNGDRLFSRLFTPNQNKKRKKGEP
jgi:hypothetical protein